MTGPRRARRVSGIVSTDDLIAAKYKHMHTDPKLLAPHLLESYAPGWAASLRPGDALVNDAIFGIGSSREQAVSTLQANGIDLVLAPRFGRILFRNCWNLGVMAIEVDTAELSEARTFTVEVEQGEVRSDGVVLARFAPPPAFLVSMARHGGLLSELSRNRKVHK